LANKIVANRRAIGDDPAVKGGKDLLSTMMRLGEAEDQDLDQLLDHIATFVLVGHETTSSAINFTLMELARNKDIQDRLRQELLDFHGSGPNGQPSYEDYQSKLPFLDAVSKEAMRIWPPVSHTERVAQKDDILPLRFPITSASGEEMTSIRIKKGQVINVSSIGINRNASVWGPDAEVFRPERWLNPEQLPAPTSLTQGWSGLFTFIEGPRICIGMRLALFEYKVILSTLLKHFEFLDAGAKVVTQFSSTTQPYLEGQPEAGVQIPMLVRELLH